MLGMSCMLEIKRGRMLEEERNTRTNNNKKKKGSLGE